MLTSDSETPESKLRNIYYLELLQDALGRTRFIRSVFRHHLYGEVYARNIDLSHWALAYEPAKLPKFSQVQPPQKNPHTRHCGMPEPLHTRGMLGGHTSL